MGARSGRAALVALHTVDARLDGLRHLEGEATGSREELLDHVEHLLNRLGRTDDSRREQAAKCLAEVPRRRQALVPWVAISRSRRLITWTATSVQLAFISPRAGTPQATGKPES